MANSKCVAAVAALLIALAIGCGDDKQGITDAGVGMCPESFLCPMGSECEEGVCVKMHILTCLELGCEQEGYECRDDDGDGNGVCYLPPTTDRTCEVRLDGPAPTEVVKMPAPQSEQVEILHFNTRLVDGDAEANGCDPRLMLLEHELFATRPLNGSTGWQPSFQMTINGQDAALTETGGGDITGQWYSRTYNWIGGLQSSGNAEGEDVRIFCTNCNIDSMMPNGITIGAKVKAMRWSRNQLVSEQPVYQPLGLSQLNIFTPPPI